MSEPGIRARNRAAVMDAITASANEQLLQVGPSELSVRAVARDLGMASSAIYRYFPSRDDLLTAFGKATELANAVTRFRDPAYADKLAKVSVKAEVVEHVKGPKIRIHKFKNKTGYHKRQGHRQQLTVLKVTGIK